MFNKKKIEALEKLSTSIGERMSELDAEINVLRNELHDSKAEMEHQKTMTAIHEREIKKLEKQLLDLQLKQSIKEKPKKAKKMKK